MRKVARCTVVVAMIFLVSMTLAPVLFAQASQSSGPVSRGAWTLGVPGLDAETSFTGQEAIVVEPGKVAKVEPMKGVKDGLQMRFVTDQGNKYVVYMGPKWFIENQKVKFMAGDKVEVRGKKFGSAIIATEISKGNMTMKLRNEEDGMPSWECCFPRSVKK
ncbi:MAG: hypothetical protein LAP86_27195 [Acidobacteriia bacterium]|nr:hypothetical protein [Terriglobia bacterium]